MKTIKVCNNVPDIGIEFEINGYFFCIIKQKYNDGSTRFALLRCYSDTIRVIEQAPHIESIEDFIINSPTLSTSPYVTIQDEFEHGDRIVIRPKSGGLDRAVIVQPDKNKSVYLLVYENGYVRYLMGNKTADIQEVYKRDSITVELEKD